jgi:N6-L-threonylcarbamoyladenine synthase
VSGLDFSFSGLKTALLYVVRGLSANELEQRRADLAASYQRAIVEALVGKALAASRVTDLDRIAVVGGVAANSELRDRLSERGSVALAPLELCTDNAVMIASAARFRPTVPYPEYLALDAYATAA